MRRYDVIKKLWMADDRGEEERLLEELDNCLEAEVERAIEEAERWERYCRLNR